MSITKCEWICPICGESRVRLETGKRPRVAAENNLLSHVRETRDDEHGSRGRYPEGFAGDDVDDDVAVHARSDGLTARVPE